MNLCYKKASTHRSLPGRRSMLHSASSIAVRIASRPANLAANASDAYKAMLQVTNARALASRCLSTQPRTPRKSDSKIRVKFPHHNHTLLPLRQSQSHDLAWIVKPPAAPLPTKLSANASIPPTFGPQSRLNDTPFNVDTGPLQAQAATTAIAQVDEASEGIDDNDGRMTTKARV